jgi:hypothetical protein
VTIPRREVERLALTAGRLIEVEVQPSQAREPLALDLVDAFRTEMAQGGDALRYLAR